MFKECRTRLRQKKKVISYKIKEISRTFKSKLCITITILHALLILKVLK